MNLKLGEQLKVARQAAHRSLQSVAEAANISTAYLHKLEGGVVNSPNPRLLLRVAEELQISYATLMHSAGYLLPTPEERAQAAGIATAATDAAPSRSADGHNSSAASNTDIVRLLHEVLTRLDTFSKQHEILLHAMSPTRQQGRSLETL